MGLAEKEIVVHYEGNEIKITVKEADLRAGFLRGRLQNELVPSGQLDIETVDLANAYWIYCDLVAGTSEVVGLSWPMDAEQFAALSDRWFHHVGAPWLEAVREVNPHWSPTYGGDDSGESEGAGG